MAELLDKYILTKKKYIYILFGKCPEETEKKFSSRTKIHSYIDYVNLQK